jgi:hypothetical protein
LRLDHPGDRGVEHLWREAGAVCCRGALAGSGDLGRGDAGKPSGEGVDVAGFDEPPIDAVCDDLGHAACTCGDHGNTSRERFDDHEAEWFGAIRGQHEYIGAVEVRADVVDLTGSGDGGPVGDVPTHELTHIDASPGSGLLAEDGEVAG